METVMSMIVLGLRFYTRTIIRRTIGWDDLMLLITWILMVTFAGLCTAAAEFGMGVYSDKLSVDDTARGMLFLLVGQSVIAVAMGLSKCAVAALLMRIVVKRWHKAFLWFWNITIMGLSILLAITVFAQCTPVQSIWDSRVPQQSCHLDLTTMATVMCAWSAILDFVLAFFPWLALWNLNMKKKEKYTVCLSLSLGVFAGICGIIRTTGLKALTQSIHYLYATTDSVIWTMSELTITIICVSIPALRPLYRSFRGSSSSDDASNYNDISPYGKSNAGNSGYALDTLVRATVQGKRIEDDAGFDGNVDELGEYPDTRNILQHQHHSLRGIYQTREVTVSYEARRPGDSTPGDNTPSVPVKPRQHI